MTHMGECGGGNVSASPTRRVAPRGARSGARGAANLCLSALGLCAALRPMAALAACGRWAKLTARRATEGEERHPVVAALSALRPRPRASGRMSRAKLEQAGGRGGNGAAPLEAKRGHGGRRAKTERALEQRQQAQRPRSPTGLGAVRHRVTSRDRGAAIIPQAVTPRTETAPRSGSRRPRGCGGGGAPALKGECGGRGRSAAPSGECGGRERRARAEGECGVPMKNPPLSGGLVSVRSEAASVASGHTPL